ncbi:MAG TPA: DUF2911 domain-containing protein [Thermoanaerobaculia bacterium]|nr:DUF2911 domain-containing protein [Thermoanaerobaculia bacterium]
MRWIEKGLVSLVAVLAVVAVMPQPAAAQDLHPSRRPSPMGMARTHIDDAYVRVVYSRPYLRGRDNIFGTKESEALVPFGEVWRTGANEATEITVTGDVTVGGETLPAGTYSLFTTPGADAWKLHFNSALGLSGTGIFADGRFTPVDLAETDVLTVEAPVTALAEDDEVDQFTISFDATEAGADMVLRWHRTEVRLPVAVAADAG